MKKLYLLIFLATASFICLFASGVIESQDGLQYLSVARNIYYLHKPIAPPLEFDEGKNVYMNVSKGKDGNYYSPTGIGYSLALVPAVAASDFLHRIYHVAPPIRFPLESDWSVLLFASFTNSLFAGLLAVYICAFALRLGIPKSLAILTAFLTVFTTNLFPLAKEGFAHMMFISMLMGTFYFIRKYSDEGKRRNLAWAGISFGIMVISYGPIYFLTFPAILVYYLLLSKPKFRLAWMVARIEDAAAGLLTALPFLIFYFLTNAQKSGSVIDSGYGAPDSRVFNTNLHILYEGTFGLLLSPGRGFYWYSPLALLPVIFWSKLNFKKFAAEIIALLLLALFFVYFFAVQNAGMDWLSWNGESSWGPRYISVLLPLCGILTGAILSQLKKAHLLLIAVPIILAGLSVQLLGVLLPYQIKFRGLQPEFRLNETRFTVADYGNFIPRYSPLINLPRVLVARIKSIRQQTQHGHYNVRFFDGVDFPFDIAGTQWRGLRPSAYIAIKGSDQLPLDKIRIGLANVPVSTASAGAIVRLYSGGQLLGETRLTSGQWGNLEVSLPHTTRELTLRLDTAIEIEKPKVQAIFIRDMSVNGIPISLKTLDFPYVQPLAAAMTRATYRYFGKIETDPWQYWYLRSQVYEETLDLWWLKALYYWDLPHPFFALIFFVISETFLVSSTLLGYTIHNAKRAN